jgi:hypothetical protein
MVNLRYHIVSLAAVFLALAVGIVVGSTVIDRAIVDALNDRVDAVERRANDTSAENRRLAGQVDVLRDFADQARDELVTGELRGVPVLVVTVQGVDRRPLEPLLDALATAEAVPAGVLSFTSKLRLDTDVDVRALATAVDTQPLGPDPVRRAALQQVASVLDGSAGASELLPDLIAAGFVSYDPPSAAGTTTTTLGLASFPVAGLRVVVVSGAGAAVPDDRLMGPFVQALAQPTGPPAVSPAANGGPRVVAAEAGDDEPGRRALFVGPLRSDGSLAPRLSTVDNIESPPGQAATVLALRDLAVPRTGHYGVGPGAQRLLPAAQT